MKVWRVLNSKCMESIHVHDDTVNAVVVGFDGLVFTGSAGGSVKIWCPSSFVDFIIGVAISCSEKTKSLLLCRLAAAASSTVNAADHHRFFLLWFFFFFSFFCLRKDVQGDLSLIDEK
ncbi:Protein JINGUBANG [Camellia lanceoleosa]|uniref:Protein JINGUBANG n=1 Tax=Camellia lanceoleosa TaxID=1840588 RepID=A0ACC0FNU2_9ERIC|nr:Protein JINGUBANG [Camellia lanceoleosa]